VTNSDSEDRQWLFIHIMKTAGTSFRRFTEESKPSDIYPSTKTLSQNPQRGWYLPSEQFINHLNQNSKELDKFRFFFGHYPYCIAELLNGNFNVATVLRDPIERSISMIKHRRQSKPELFSKMSDIEILKKTNLLDNQIRNYQTKVLGMAATSSLEVNAPAQSEEHLLECALKNLEQLDFLGISERMQETEALWKKLEPSFSEASVPFVNKSKVEIPVSDEVLGLLQRNLKMDTALYQEATHIFNQTIKTELTAAL